MDELKDENVIQQIARTDINAPRMFTECVEKDYGLLFCNNENKYSYDSNHAVITNPDADLRSAVADIVAFYRSQEQTPRLYHGYLDSEEEQLFPVLREMGFEIELNENKTFIRHSQASPRGPATKNPKVRRLRAVESGFRDILREDDGGDWNLHKWTRCIQDPRAFVFAQPNEDGDTVAIAALLAYDEMSVIEDVVTSPKYRRKGFATNMLTQIVEFHESLGNSNPLNLVSDNPDAIRVYERLGFMELKHGYQLWMAYLE